MEKITLEHFTPETKNIIKVDEVEQKIKNQNIKKIHLPRHERNLLKHINIYDIFNE